MSENTEHPSDPKAQTPDLDTFHILVVDDEEDVLEILIELIRADGYRVSGAESGEKALEALQRESIDLVLTDLMMPGMNGWELLTAIKQNDESIPVIVITGFITEQSESILTDHQADGYLIKPIDQRRLQVLLKAHLFSHNLGRSVEVVLVDDDKSTLQAVDETLSKRGILVAGFEVPDEALQHILASPPDLVILDLLFPNASGFDLCKALHQTPETQDIPILILTAQSSKENLLQAIRLGVQGFVAKPFDPDELAERILKILRQSNA